MKNLRLLFFALFLGCLVPILSYSQGIRYDTPPILTSTGTPIKNPVISLCPGTATVSGIGSGNAICSPASAQSTTDITNGTLCPVGSPVTLTGLNTCQATGDTLGNAGFWLKPGAYIYCINAPGFNGQCYNVTVPIGVSASGNVNVSPNSLTAGAGVFTTGSFSGALSGTSGAFSGAVSSASLAAQNIGGVVYADQFTGADWCAKVQAADTSLGATHGEIWINANATPLNACATVPTITAGHTLRFIQGGVYSLSNTLTIKGNGTRLIGVGAGMGEFGSQSNTGVTLQAISGTFPSGSATPVVRFFDLTKGGLDHVNIDCNGVANCVDIRYDSDNNPPSSQNTFENFTLRGAHWGFVMGALSQSLLVSSAGCNSNPNQNGCYQMDTDRVENFQIYGASGDNTAVGFLINSANGFQNGKIYRGNIQSVNKGIQIVNYNGSGELNGFNFGNPVGSSPVAIELDANVAPPTIIENMETEGTGWTNGIHDSSCNPLSTTPQSPWIGNNFFGSGSASTGALVDGCAFIVSIANGGQSSTFTSAGTARVISLGDQRVWTTSGSGTLDYWYNGNFNTGGSVTAGTSVNATTNVVATLAVSAGTSVTATTSVTGAKLVANGSAAGVGSAAVIGYDATNNRASINNNNASIFDVGVLVGTGNVTTAGTNVTTGTCQAQTGISVSNSAVTDSVTANIGATLPATWQTGITLQAHVTTAGTVTVYLCNPTAGTITPAATQVNVRVLR